MRMSAYRGMHGNLGLTLGVDQACYFFQSRNYDGVITSIRVGNDNQLQLQKASHFHKKLSCLKVSFFQKDLLVSLDSPKKQTNEFVFSTQTAFRDAKRR